MKLNISLIKADTSIVEQFLSDFLDKVVNWFSDLDPAFYVIAVLAVGLLWLTTKAPRVLVPALGIALATLVWYDPSILSDIGTGVSSLNPGNNN